MARRFRPFPFVASDQVQLIINQPFSDPGYGIGINITLEFLTGLKQPTVPYLLCAAISLSGHLRRQQVKKAL
ncbi:hypothetical protein [Mucilaginibacter segetis]|jgi:hypothetical protein|uniref:Uncharacterized protein n=1 Tax=Mucilaginibacter segetis TaxID=2793071 RepID=A0A934PSL5_9SPHI|nr:hypothetical protein [Mucilaginibacter segetis]MBK0380043.1 hypothetical protein [Mucilaginibacter segetis]